MIIRKATEKDIDAVEILYDEIHTAEEDGKQTIGWIRGIYPIRTTAEKALEADELFVLEEYRSKGLGRELFKYIEENGDKKLRRIRLEVELENGRAISLYKKMGFEPAPYDGMWKTIL